MSSGQHSPGDGARKARGGVLGFVVLGVAAGVNAYFLFGQVTWATEGLPLNDWKGFSQIDPLDPLDESWVKWSVPAAWAISALVVPLGFEVWALLHLAALALLRNLGAALVVLVSFPFWGDVLSGNIMVFILVAAWWALRGNRAGIVAYCLLAALVPRPIMVPILVLLLLRYSTARWAFAASAAVVLGITSATGDLGTWVDRLLSASDVEMGETHNFAPSRFIGPWWILVAWPAAAWTWRRGYLGLASLLISPYWLGYYFLIAGVDLPRFERWLEGTRPWRGLAPESAPAV